MTNDDHQGQMMMKPPLQCCSDCGQTCRTNSGICRPCQVVRNASPDMLEDGRWVLDRRARVLRWEAA